MHYLFIFPHPDDESFGPASSIFKLIRENNDVSLLTLTKGGATKVRHKLNYSVSEMGDVRYNEMLEVNKVLGFKNMTVLDLPDSGLKFMNPVEIENVVKRHIQNLQPDILVTYPVHGISGFHDHLVTHAVVKRVFCENKNELNLKRLAFFTLSEEYVQSNDGIHRLNFSNIDEIDCILQLDEIDIDKMNESLDCYKTYKEVIEKSIKKLPPAYKGHFEFFGEKYNPAVDRLDFDLGN